MPTRRYKITKDELKEAYIKYKAHVYHDTSELYQRRKLAEFKQVYLIRGDRNHNSICF